jgi:glyoxylase-like metal-dependent hydrolase (beta-lactamase superfamily II)
MTATFHCLAPGITVIERGWLNCNQIVLRAPDRNVLIDSGYGRHAAATIGYVDEALGGASLHWLLNTHCHSDHMGGNRALGEYFGCRVTIPAGEVRHVVPWTGQSCWSEQMDQYAEQFDFDDTLVPGDTFAAGGVQWEAVAAPGHDMDALMFHCASAGILVTGDALWERGMGFVWPERRDDPHYVGYIDAARAALDTIEGLAPRTVVPGHGAPFTDLASALAAVRGRLSTFESDPAKNARHALKSLFVYALLDRGSMRLADVPAYVKRVPVYSQMREVFLGGSNDELATRLVSDLVRAGALSVQDGVVRATMRA